MEMTKKEIKAATEHMRHNIRFYEDESTSDEYPIATTIYMVGNRIEVICPYCLEIHVHGRGISSPGYHHRVPGCGHNISLKEHKNNGYVIEIFKDD